MWGRSMADIVGTPGADNLVGTENADTITGGAGNDTIEGRGGNDNLNGESGIDTLHGGLGDDTLTDTNGYDTLNGDDGNDTFNVTVVDNGSGVEKGGMSGGAGNDTLNLWANGGMSTYGIDLGAGDDTVSVRQMTYNRVDMTLGSGRDTVVLSTNMTLAASHSYIRFTDFEAGANGDVYQVSEFARAWMQKYFGYVVPADANLFAFGYLELRQVGDNVELWFHPEGVEALHSAPLAVFYNTLVGDLTAENFGGMDPVAPKNASLFVDGSYTIAQGENVTVTLDPDGGTARALVFDSGSSVLTNNGLISATNNVAGGGAVGILQSNYIVQQPGGLIHNTATGRIEVNAELSGQGSRTFGITAKVSVLNEGIIDVNAGLGEVYGIRTFEYLGLLLDNRGTITVDGDIAYGILLGNSGPMVINSGDILVNGDTFAAGVYARFGDVDQLFNHGDIIATSANGISVGYYVDNLGTLDDNQLITLVNTGTISADYAIYGNVVNAGLDNGFSILNSGTLNGYIRLNTNDDYVLNRGTMNGIVELGAGNDVYFGEGGLRTGEVYGGSGDDLIIGGSSAEALFGDAGSDRISGGVGDDYIAGGAGNDALEGGAGLDTVSYLDSSIGLTIDLNLGSATGSAETDRISGFEDVMGSGQADIIRGSSSSNILFGARGDDRLEGRNGNDSLIGGRGDDTVDGGWGDDRFMFTRGDGFDQILDFGRGADRIEVFGYTTIQSVTQVGANVLITLDAENSILVMATTTAKAIDALYIYANPLVLPDSDIIASSIYAVKDFVLQEGAVLSYTDPFFEGAEDAAGLIPAAVLLVGTAGQASPAYYNAGTLLLDYAGDGIVAGVNFHLGYGDRQHTVANYAAGTIAITTATADAAAVFGMEYVYNAGTITVQSETGHVSGISDTGDTVVNAGTITVSTTASASGIGALPTTSMSFVEVHNSGDINVHGGLIASGIDVRAFQHPASTRDTLVVNSGSITVTDDTAAIDSAAIRFDTSGKFSLWNSGTITGDYAIARNQLLTGGSPSVHVSANIYNSGTLNGEVQLANPQEVYLIDFTFINTGTINGNITFSSGDDLYDGRLGVSNNTILGGSGNDILLGGSGNQRLVGGGGNDVLFGGWGNDSLRGSGGADIFRFETNNGTDKIEDFDGVAGDRVHIRGYSAWQSIEQVGNDVVVTFAANHKLIFLGRTVADVQLSYFVFDVAAIARNNIPDAPAASTTPDMPTGVNAVPEFFRGGTSGSDAIYGKNGVDDRLIGRDGNDVFKISLGDGLGGTDDLMIGGRGDDTYFVNELGDLVIEAPNEGIDLVRAYVNYTLPVNVENLRLYPSATEGIGNELDNVITGTSAGTHLMGMGGNDRLNGAVGVDLLEGGDGDDLLVARGGNDTLYGNNGNDDLRGENGNDQMFGGAGDDTLTGGNGNDFMDGDQDPDGYFGNDRLEGGAGDDALFGGKGNDVLFGDDGNDLIWGNAGRDLLTGGTGADTFSFNFWEETGVTVGTADRIFDFNRAEGDKIQLYYYDDDNNQGLGYAFIGTDAFSGVAGQARYEKFGTYTMIYVDNDGDMVADAAVCVLGQHDFLAADFVV